MSGWASINPKMNPGALNDQDVLMGALPCQKSGVDFIQNCDLPPPVKVFSGSDKTVISSMNRIFSMMGHKKTHFYGGNNDDENLELLKALRFSQTRTREAERKAETLTKERDWVYNALIQELLRLSTYRRWVRLLEVQALKLQLQWQQRPHETELCPCQRSEKVERCVNDEVGEDNDRVPWIVALAICLGIAGVGLAIGWRYVC